MFRPRVGAALQRNLARSLSSERFLCSSMRRASTNSRAPVTLVAFAPYSTATTSPAARLNVQVCTSDSSFAVLSGFSAASKAAVAATPVSTSLFCTARRGFSTTTLLRSSDGKPSSGQLAGFNQVQHRKPDEEKKEEDEGAGADGQGGNQGEGYLPFPSPFHTINIISILFTGNLILYFFMNFFASDDWKDWVVDHFTLSHENYSRIYPFFTSTLYQEQIFQLAIDCWLLMQFGATMMGFLGPKRLLSFWIMTSVGSGLIHVGRQFFELHVGLDPLEVRGRCYGPSPFILGLVSAEGLVFRHLNFIQQPPVPFLVLTALVMAIDVWRIFTIKPEEHGASTGGALVAYVFWCLPTRMMGLDKLTAAM